MSHKTEIKTTLNSKKHLIKALEQLGFEIEVAEGNTLTTRGNYGVHEKVEILVKGNGTNSFNSAVGFKRNEDGTYTATGDFFGLRTADGHSVSAEYLKCEVGSHAKEAEVNERLANLMFQLDPSTRKETKEEISFTLQRWVD